MFSFLKYLLVFTAGMSFVAYMYNRSDLPENATTQAVATKELVTSKVDAAIPKVKKFIGKLNETSQRVVKQQTDDFTKIYNRLGLKHGDMIKKVNDLSVVDAAAYAFPALVEGFKKGNVCVTYQRNGEDRETCLKKNPASENVTDKSVSSN